MPDLDFFVKIGQAVLSLLLIAGISCFLGAIFEMRNWVRWASFVARPLIKYSRLPDICGTAFLTAILSNNAANSMVSGAYHDKAITHREMLLSALANSFPTKVYHNLKVIYLVPLLGTAGIIYFAVQFFSGLLRTFIVLTIARLSSNKSDTDFEEKEYKKLPWKETFSKAKKRTTRLLLKILKIAVPLYLVIHYITYLGVFEGLEKNIPESLSSVLSTGIISIVIARLANLVSAAQLATDLLKAGDISVYQIVIALYIGNIVTMPFRTIQRNLTTAMSIFPRKDAVTIVSIVQGSRVLAALITIVVLVVLDNL